MKFSLVLSFALTVATFSVGCGKRQPTKSASPAEEYRALASSLTKLDETLASKSPFMSARLAPGATEEELKTLRAGLGGVQVDALERWFQWHNGCAGGLTDVLPLGRMLSIEEALEDRASTQAMAFVDAKRKSALKILDDGAGDGYFLDIESPTPRVFYHMLEDPFPRDFGTLPEFVTFIGDVHAAGVASVNDDGTVTFDLDRYQKIEDDYLKSIGAENE